MAVHDSSLRSLTPESKFLTHYYFNKCILSACHVPGTINAKTLRLDCVFSVQGVARRPGWWERSQQGESGRKGVR